MHFDLIDLRLFLLVAEAGSITEGASRAGLALASASARLRGMEEQAGTPLLERLRRGIRPTAAGLALLHHARIVTEQVERMRGDLGGFARGVRGRVRLLSNTAAAEFLPGPLARFLAEHDQVDVEVEERGSAQVVQGVLDGAGELGLAADHVDVSGLEVRPFRLDRLVAVLPPGHALAGEGRIGFARVLGFDLVGLSRGSALQQHLDSRAARLGLPLRLRARFGSVEAVCRAVAEGAGLGVLPEVSAAPWVHAGRLAAVRLSDSWAERRLRLVMRREQDLPLHARRLATALIGHDDAGV